MHICTYMLVSAYKLLLAPYSVQSHLPGRSLADFGACRLRARSGASPVSPTVKCLAE